jgi:hypothetical protein
LTGRIFAGCKGPVFSLAPTIVAGFNLLVSSLAVSTLFFEPGNAGINLTFTLSSFTCGVTDVGTTM